MCESEHLVIYLYKLDFSVVHQAVEGFSLTMVIPPGQTVRNVVSFTGNMD